MSNNGAGQGGGGAMLKFSVGRSGTAPAHLAYITRESATQSEHARVWTRNIPDGRNRDLSTLVAQME